ncbi:multicopper oxidase family protein [Carboxydocella sp. ULO1]|uniref:multicopper oxidase family protein n=1 Tax=Carboxydocella sp. ULO1 TaxID=1926599 RepID=UPI0009CD69D8|nr:multicopper oxidase family protein [Carboxydocella sp. ULO1]GAW29201.1 hypothetical protein ULO1_17710 [Carboxydocella sp. ULO1]
MHRINRRDFLRYSGFAGFSLLTGGIGAILEGCTIHSTKTPKSFVTPLIVPDTAGPLALYKPDSETFKIEAGTAKLKIVNEKESLLNVYKIKHQEKTLINPTILVQKGQELRVTLENGLSEDTIIHWHGLMVEDKMDGHPAYAIKPGERYEYKFKVKNRGGTYWYHPHPENLTAKQAYKGLAGILLVEDEEELQLRQSLELELGKNDIPLVIQDKRFDQAGNILYNPDDMEKIMGFHGNKVLVNLTLNPLLKVAKKFYRFRILNGSNARIYCLSLHSEQRRDFIPIYLIGTDGGLLDKPYKINKFFISPGERADILVDFTSFNTGEELFFKSLAFDPMDNEDAENMDNMGMQHDSLKAGEEINILKIVINRETEKTFKIPQNLSSLKPINIKDSLTRKFRLSFTGKQWQINGQTFNISQFPVIVKKHSKEIWEIANDKKSMPHPMHLHGFMFQVLQRLNSPKQVQDLAIDQSGRTAMDLGWKDTVLIWPGETVRIAIDFTHDFTGDQVYLFHCHNLEHEDLGMMLNLKVKE